MKSNCINCDKEFSFMPSQQSGKYCSNKCQLDYQYKNVTKNRIELGQVNQSRTLRRYLTEERGGYKCNECGIANWNGKEIALHIDHIDGNSDNNFPSNLRFLCPNCHSQTHTYCGRNKKNSKRATYKQRYRLRKLHE
jgi:Zn finger protein HypA/HybF involved in hydrogenase expression